MIEAFVDALDLLSLGFGGAMPVSTGRPAYHPAVLLKLYIYGISTTCSRPSPRGYGMGKYLDAHGLAILGALDGVSACHRARPAEVALAWLMAREGVTAPIASATHIGHVESFARAAELGLTAEDIDELDGANG